MFIKLGVSGTDKVVGSLGDVKHGLDDVKGMSLEAKAGILGAIYALEQMGAASANTGLRLENFNTITGMSTDKLQHLENAMRHYAGVSKETVDSTVVSIQTKLTKMLSGKGAPEAFGWFKNAHIDFDAAKLTKDADGAYYAIAKAAELAKSKYMSTAKGTDVLRSLMPDEMIAGLRKSKGDLFNNNFGFVNSPKMIGDLARVKTAWLDFEHTISHAMDVMTAKQGTGFINGLQKITLELIKLVNQLGVVEEKFKLFDKAAKMLEGMANSLRLVNEVIEKMGGKESKPGDILYVKPGQEAVPGFNASPVGQGLSKSVDAIKGLFNHPAVQPGGRLFPNPAIGPAPRIQGGHKTEKHASNTVNTNLNVAFNSQVDAPVKVAETMKKHLTNTLNQMDDRLVWG